MSNGTLQTQVVLKCKNRKENSELKAMLQRNNLNKGYQRLNKSQCESRCNKLVKRSVSAVNKSIVPPQKFKKKRVPLCEVTNHENRKITIENPYSNNGFMIYKKLQFNDKPKTIKLKDNEISLEKYSKRKQFIKGKLQKRCGICMELLHKGRSTRECIIHGKLLINKSSI